jgi:hypothetical protein
MELTLFFSNNKTVVIVLYLLLFLAVSCRVESSVDGCTMIQPDYGMTSNARIRHIAINLLDNSLGITGSRRKEIEARRITVNPWRTFNSPDSSRGFVVVIERDVVIRIGAPKRLQSESHSLQCFSFVYERIVDSLYIGHILQNLYFVSWPESDSINLHKSICRHYFSHSSRYNGYALWPGYDYPQGDPHILNPLDSGFWTRSVVWSQLRKAKLGEESFYFVMTDSTARIVDPVGDE